MRPSTGSRSAKIIETIAAAGARLSNLVTRLGRADSRAALTRLRLSGRRFVVLPGVDLPGRPGLLLLTALLLGLLCVVLTFRVRPSSQAAGELVLLSGPSSSNLNNTSEETPGRAPASPATMGQGSPDPGSNGFSPPAESVVRRGSMDAPSNRLSPDVRIAIGRIEKSASGRTDGAALRALAAAHLVEGDVDWQSRNRNPAERRP